MPTIFTHPIPALALAAGLGKNTISPRLAAAAAVAAILPDLDTIGYHLGMGHGALAVHRGASHSLLAAVLLGCVGLAASRSLRSKRLAAFLLPTVSAASHGLLDAMTTGRYGVAFFWPFDQTRYSLPWHPIQISPLSPGAFFSERGLAVLLSEMQYVWLPCLLFVLLCFVFRALCREPGSKPGTAARYPRRPGDPDRHGPVLLPAKAAVPARVLCPARSGRHAGRCPCPHTSRGLRPEGCGYLQQEGEQGQGPRSNGM